MSIRLDPRRLGILKRLAGEAGVRPGDLVRQWTEERLDAERSGTGGPSLADRVTELVRRVEALEAGANSGVAAGLEETAPPVKEEAEAPAIAADAPAVAPASEPEPAASRAGRTRAAKVSAAPRERVALHDEMIAVLAERGPMSAADLASAVAERGRYSPPRSGKPLDAAMISQRVSNPTYRARFTRAEGRIGLADASGSTVGDQASQ